MGRRVARSLVLAGALLLSIVIGVHVFLMSDVLSGLDAPELAIVPTSAPIPLGALPALSLHSVSGVTVGIPCTVAGEPTRGTVSTFIKCTNERALIVEDPDHPPTVPWAGDSPVERDAQAYLIRVAGEERPQALMKAWLSMSPDALSWLTPPWTAFTIEYLLRTKLMYVSGDRHLYELSGDAVGFQFGSSEHSNRVELLLFAGDSSLHRLTLLSRPTTRFTQSEVLAIAASFRVTP